MFKILICTCIFLSSAILNAGDLSVEELNFKSKEFLGQVIKELSATSPESRIFDGIGNIEIVGSKVDKSALMVDQKFFYKKNVDLLKAGTEDQPRSKDYIEVVKPGGVSLRMGICENPPKVKITKMYNLWPRDKNNKNLCVYISLKTAPNDQERDVIITVLDKLVKEFIGKYFPDGKEVEGF